jgi:NitT/TauT family transport system substrate-binding protein
MTARIRWVAALLVVLALGTGLAFRAPGAAAQEKITFRMNWYWGGIHAPFLLAKERGYFEQAGLNVEIAEGKGSATTVQLVGTKSDTFGWADGSSIALNTAKGVPVKAVATILNVLPYAVVALEEKNIRTAKDLEGKSLAITPGDGLTQTWPAVVAANKLDASRIRLVHMAPQAKIPAVTEKQVDALLGGADDQAISIEAKGFKTRAIKFGDLGVPLIGFAILAHQDTIKERPDLVRKVVAASIKGFEDALKDPEAAVAAVKKVAPLVDADVVRKQLAVDLSLLFSKANPQKRVGWGPPEDWQSTIELLKQYRGMETSLPATAFYTNEFLP